MTIEQTVEIPADRRLHLDVSLPETALARGVATVLVRFPSQGEAQGQSKNEAFRNALRRAYGAWAADPWENAMEDIRAMREEWGHRDFWNPDPARRHRD